MDWLITKKDMKEKDAKEIMLVLPIQNVSFTKSKMSVLQNRKYQFYQIHNVSFTNPKCQFYKIQNVRFTKSKMSVLHKKTRKKQNQTSKRRE